MSGSSYWPMSAVYVHGTAPFSRIHATATEVSSPPENAMPTRSPTGREVRTLLKRVALRSDGVRQVQQVVGQRSSAGRVPGHDEDGVIPGDRPENLGQAGAVEGGREELRRARWSAEHDQIGTRLDRRQELAD